MAASEVDSLFELFRSSLATARFAVDFEVYFPDLDFSSRTMDFIALQKLNLFSNKGCLPDRDE